ncbi:hypothetical protein GQ54DRAFT_240921, partial [Martensiomyces pterosporus]
MKAVLRAWTALAQKSPILTLAATNGILGGVGDILAQTAESKNRHDRRLNWDHRRTIRFVTWGAVCAPIFHKWYLFLNRCFPLPALHRRSAFAAALAKRVLADQMIYAPVGIAAFFVAMNAMEGHSWASAKARLSEYYWPTLAANYTVWPAVQSINFGFIPTIYRVPFCSVVSIFWNAFISWTNAR